MPAGIFYFSLLEQMVKAEKKMSEEEIEELTLEIANTRSISPQTKEDVLNEFYQVCLTQQYIAEGGIGYAKELLEKALGEEKAQGVISKLTASLQVRPFSSKGRSQYSMPPWPVTAKRRPQFLHTRILISRFKHSRRW